MVVPVVGSSRAKPRIPAKLKGNFTGSLDCRSG
jgi:hypothetical protein